MSPGVKRCLFWSSLVLTGLGIGLGWWYFSRTGTPPEGSPANDVKVVAANAHLEEASAESLGPILDEWEQSQQAYQKALRDWRSASTANITTPRGDCGK